MTTSYDEPVVNTPVVNIPLLRKGLEWVEWQDALPEIDSQWRQDDYVMSEHRHALHLVSESISCGLIPKTDVTKQVKQVAEHCGTAYCYAGYIGQLCDPRYKTTDTVDGMHVAEFAIKQLGITQDQADWLFEGSNDAEDIREICETIAGEKL